MHVCSAAQSRLPLCGPMDYSPRGSSVQGIFQARILEWVAIYFSRDLTHPGIEPMSLVSPALAGGSFITSTTWEAPDTHMCVTESLCFTPETITTL